MESITRTRLRDQKGEADAALVKLQDLLHEVFEAEDQLEPGSEKPTAVFSIANSLEVSGSYSLQTSTVVFRRQ